MLRTLKITSLLGALILFSGCSSLEKNLENRVSCTLDGTRLVYTSFYGPIGVSSKVVEEDSKSVCGNK